MDFQLNAVEDDASGGETSPSTAPPAFSMPVSRISAGGGVSLSSLLSAASPQTPQDAPRFELPIARHAGLSSLMNSPLADTAAEPQQQRVEAEVGQENVQRGVMDPVLVQHGPPEIEDDGEEDVHKQDDVVMAERDGGEQMDEEISAAYDEGSAKRPRGLSIASEASGVSTPPSSAAAVQSPASVAVHIDSLVLQDPELDALKMSLDTAIHKYLSAEAKASAPPAKRRKGKQQQKKRASQAATQAQAESSSSAVIESLGDVAQCITKIHEKIIIDLSEVGVLRDAVRLCLTYIGVVNASDPVQTSVSSSESIKAALENLQQKSIHLQLASTIRRVMFSVAEETIPVIFTDVVDWIVSSRTEATAWSWLFVFFAQFDSFAVIDFFVQHAVFHQSSAHAQEESQLASMVLEYLVANRGAEVVEAVMKVIQAVDAKETSIDVPVHAVLSRLLSMGLRSRPLLRAMDGSFQWIFTKELVIALWKKIFGDGDVAPNGASDHGNESIFSSLLMLVDDCCSELEHSNFQLVLLLQQLTAKNDPAVPRELHKVVSRFHADIVRIAQNQADQSIIRSIHRRLGYITQTSVELLAENDESSAPSLAQARLESWKHWLVVVATSISRREVTDRLLQAYLSSSAAQLPQQSSTITTDSFCDLLSSIVEPSSPEFVVLVREITDWLKVHDLSRMGQHRLLSIVARLLELSGDDLASDATITPLELPTVSALDDVDAIVQAFSRMQPCRDSWTRLERWRAASGAELWEYLLDLVHGVAQDNPTLATEALHLLGKTPFPSLENPAWQYRCLRKLATLYFYSLRRYRSSVIDLDASQDQRREERQQLGVIRSILCRVCAFDGAVAHYPSSVCSQFTSLWLDSLFSTASATSVPTHFPSSVKGGSILSKKSPPTSSTSERRSSIGDDHVVIRSERTISSKCTNLQSSQVITKHSDTLVYRKALDETWEREMHAALTCSMLATDVLGQVLNAHNPDVEGDKRERRMKVMVDMLLERALPCCGVSSDDVYKDILPNRSSFDMDLRVEQWLNHFPAFLPLLRLVIEQAAALPTSAQALRLVPVIKSALVVLICHWNSVKGELDFENMDVPPYMRNRNQLSLSCEVVRILRLSNWIPAPLARTAELLPLTTPADIRGILFSCWFFLADHPPTSTSSTNAQPNASPSKMPIEFYVLPVRQALHRNIHKVGAKYAKFMC